MTARASTVLLHDTICPQLRKSLSLGPSAMKLGLAGVFRDQG